MGLFWGSDKKKTAPPPPQQRELTEHEKLMQKLTQPLELGYVTGCGPASASPDFTYLIRNINDGVYKNNGHIREMKEMLKELLIENKNLRERVERLEQQNQR